ncbi:sigma-70 family RNA polymerase sigma factor [Blautia pseudococcoides]|uniref:RNA polymerase sigma factor n=1 Tax=Blautia pseudococcoides TaxID=1796616 RepID=UPI00148B16FD|nr:sigma factor-like helix-turn-helix DNA-binding protein [Blautia pseudococcoides]QJU16626.1 sigma-70 family RNA polymerase sigma factor [Blautia pseudococcoides]
MDHTPSRDELTVMHQFDRLCQLALDGEAANYYRHMEYRRNHEVIFSEMTEKELDSIFVMDEYNLDSLRFRVLGYDIEVKDALLVEALQALTEKKRNVVLLSYFLEMTDTEIATEMKLVHSTIREHRTRSLELLKKFMEENMDGAEE